MIIASIEAIKAVPNAQREGAYALGATRWQMVRGSVFPAAAPGIMTGIILAMARAIGEAAPLILIGAVGFVTFRRAHSPAPTRCFPCRSSTGRSARRMTSQAIASAAIIVILVLMLVLNGSRTDRPNPPFETHPVVEENSVNAQISEAPVLDSADRRRRADDPYRDDAARGRGASRRRRPASTSSSCRMCPAITARSAPFGTSTSTVAKNAITALIGPSGCGKSTLIRTINRMNDLVPSYRSEGRILLDGQDLFAKSVDPVAVRRRVGMVFQKPNPFPKSVYDNVAFGPRINGYKGNMDELVEGSLRRAALWDDVKDKLKQSGMALSGGQQQRLCIARTIAVNPEVILMDEPCSALDPRSTLQIEELMAELKLNYTIVIVTHNMQQAARASDTTVFMTMGDDRAGYVVEQARTIDIFTNPKNQLTEDYVSGRFG